MLARSRRQEEFQADDLAKLSPRRKGKPLVLDIGARIIERFVLLAMHQTRLERGIPQPGGRKKIAQRFIAGFPRGGGTSPVRDERI